MINMRTFDSPYCRSLRDLGHRAPLGRSETGFTVGLWPLTNSSMIAEVTTEVTATRPRAACILVEVTGEWPANHCG